MLKLYELAAEYQEILDWIDDHAQYLEAAGGALPDDIADRLDRIEGDFDQKVEKIGLIIRQMEANATAAAQESERLDRLADHHKNAADGLRSYLKLHMERVGVQRVNGTLTKVWIQKNSQPRIRPVDPSNPPRQFIRVTHAELFDAAAALAALRSAGTLPDAAGRFEVGGLVVERGTHLVVR